MSKFFVWRNFATWQEKKEVAKGTKGFFVEKMGPSCHGTREKSPKVATCRY